MTNNPTSQSIRKSLRGLKEFGYLEPKIEFEDNPRIIIINGVIADKEETAKVLHSLLLSERSRRDQTALIDWASETFKLEKGKQLPCLQDSLTR